MFGDAMKLQDVVGVRLQCAHEFTGGAMECTRCGEPYSEVPNVKVEHGKASKIELTKDGL
jgi:hypothetical protein